MQSPNIHQNMRAYPKNFTLIKNYENIVAYWKESKKSEVQANKYGLFQTHMGALKVGATPGKHLLFKLGKSILNI